MSVGKYAARILWDFIKEILFMIPLAAIISALWWFFVGLVLRNEITSFTELFRNIYILSSAFVLLLDVIGLLKKWFYTWRIARRLQVRFMEVIEAIDVLKMHKERAPSEWDREWFLHTLSVKKLSREFADAVMKRIRY